MLEWSDYRLILAIARGRGLPAAGEALGITLSTAYRRLEAIEARLGDTVFHRRRGDYEPTDLGRAYVTAAEAMEQAVTASERARTGQGGTLAGPVRVTSSETLSACFLARHMPAFAADYPGITYEILSQNGRLSLADQEADVALRPGRPSEEGLFGRKIADLDWGLYRGPGNVSQDIITWRGNAAAERMRRTVLEAHPELREVGSSTSLITNAHLAQGGTAAYLPCILGRSMPGLTRVTAPVEALHSELWMVCHEETRRNARIAALFRFLTEAARTDRALFLA